MGAKVATFVILAIYVAIMVGIGIYTSRRTKSTEDFMLGGRSVGSWLTAFSYGTTYFSAVVFIGYAGQFGWLYGMSAAWVGIGNAIIGSLIPFFLLGRRTRLMTNHLGAKTMPEFFEHRFDSKALKTVSAAIVFIFLIPYTASVYNGLSRLFGMVFNLGSNGGTYIIIAMAVLSAIYVTLGGYKATALNDFFQGIIMLIGIGTVVVLTVQKKNGLSEAVDALNAIRDDKGNLNTLGSVFGPEPLNLLGVVILTSLGTWGLPQMVQKFYAIKDEKAVKTGTVVSTFFAIIIAGGCYFLGGFGRLFGEVKGVKEVLADGTVKVAFDNIVPSMLSTLPDILIGVVVVLVFSASMSTLSSLVLTSSSTLTLDLIKPIMGQRLKEKTSLLLMKIFVVCFIAISVVIAFNPPTFIAQLMGVSWGALAGAFLAPFMYGLYSRKITKASVWASYIVGVGFTVVNMIHPIIKSPINAGAATMIAGLIIVPLVSLITPKPDAEKVDNIFACYDTVVSVPERENLGK